MRNRRPISFFLFLLGWATPSAHLEGAVSISNYTFDDDFEAAFTQSVETGSGSWIQEDGVGKFLNPASSFTRALLKWKPYDLL